MTKHQDKKKNKNKEKKAVLSEIDSFIQPFFTKKLLSHLYVACGRFDDSILFEYKTQENIFFDLASLTKTLSTLVLIYRQKKRGLLLSQTVGEWLGKKRGVFSSQINELKIISLLRHNSGLPFWKNFWINNLNPESRLLNCEQRLERVASRLNAITSSEYNPGRYVYSDLGYMLLGVVLELLNEKDLAQQFKELSIEELALNEQALLVFPPSLQKIEKSKFVPTSFCPIRGRMLIGEVHDENAASLGGVCGHAGLFGSGEAIIKYLEALWQSTIGKEILNGNLELAATIENPEQKCLLGWMKESQEDIFRDDLVISHLGFTGTGIWIFPKQNTYILILTNRVISARLSSWIHSFRMGLCKILKEKYLEVDT